MVRLTYLQHGLQDILPCILDIILLHLIIMSQSAEALVDL